MPWFGPSFDAVLPIGFALFVWWFSTGVIIFLDNLPQRSFRWSMLAVTLLAGLAFHRLGTASMDVSVHGAYTGFVCALTIWAWQEMSFLMGVVTGPRRVACAPDCRGRAHFIHGVQVVIYHELAIAVGAAAIAAFCWGGANQVALATYVILWGMRISAKLCLFLGVRNVSERFLPPHLAYLGGFFRQRRMNALLPLSVVVGCVLSALLIQVAMAAEAGSFETIAASLLATMAVLGVVEHVMLVLPIPFEALWNWYLRTRAAGRAEAVLQQIEPLKTCCPHAAPQPSPVAQ